MIINSKQNLIKLLNSCTTKTFQVFNFGCRVNAAEINQLSEFFLENNFSISDTPEIFLINTCSITKKGDTESLSKIRVLQNKYPTSKFIVTGCANYAKLSNIYILDNKNKEKILKSLNSFYSPKIGDKYTPYRRFLLKVQSGCTQNCTYCIVPKKRPYLYSLPISDTIKTIKKIENDYDEIIITGVNLIQYKYGFSNLLEKILAETNIKLISFGSIPLNCIDEKFIKLLNNSRLSHFLHIPIQSGSDRILKLMHRPYNRTKIFETFSKLKNCQFGTDIIVGFPTESEQDFQDTLDICKKINFQKIHTFRYSPRPETDAKQLFNTNIKIKKEELKNRSLLIRSIAQTTIPFHQKQDN